MIEIEIVNVSVLFEGIFYFIFFITETLPKSRIRKEEKGRTIDDVYYIVRMPRVYTSRVSYILYTMKFA